MIHNQPSYILEPLPSELYLWRITNIMHPKNPFAEDYNFDKLVKASPPLGKFVFVNKYGNKTIKFADRNAVLALNTALLKSQYEINWSIPQDMLCPPIPGRLDYLLHIADLISKDDVQLLDIGTGANLIYPILATCHFGWKCTASEVHKQSIGNAAELIKKNEVLKSIELRVQKSNSNVLEGIIQQEDVFDVVVCNPPFYETQFDAQKANRRKVKNLNLKSEKARNFGGSAHELWYAGGEVAFLEKMIIESIQYKEQVHWFTGLVSKDENVPTLKKAIQKMHPSKLKVIQMELGNKKSRFIAWSHRK